MPTVQFAEVPNKSSISNNCCAFAIMFIYYCSTWYPWSVAIFSEAVYGYGPIFMQLFLTFCQRLSSKMSHFYHISSVHYTGMSLSLRSYKSHAFWNNFRLHVLVKAQSFQIYVWCMHLLSPFSLNLPFYEHKKKRPSYGIFVKSP